MSAMGAISKSGTNIYADGALNSSQVCEPKNIYQKPPAINNMIAFSIRLDTISPINKG